MYVDGNTYLVDGDSSKTIVTFNDKMTVSDVAKAVENFINKEYPPKKPASTVDYKTDTRTIVTADDEKAKELKKKYHGKGTKVRIMKRKSGNKVYIDSKTPEIHKAINDALGDEFNESSELGESNTDKYMWSDINNALKAAGLNIRTILSVMSKLKGKEIKEEIDLAEVKEAKIDNYISMLKKTYNNLKTMDPNSDLWKNLNKQLSNLSDDDLKKVVDAKIKWASMMAEPMLKYGKFANLRHGGKK